MAATPDLRVIPLKEIPTIHPGAILADYIFSALKRARETLQDGDILVVAQKVISKAEDRYVNLEDIEPGEEAESLAAAVNKDPRFVELVLQQSRKVIKYRRDVLIVEHKLGFIHANAGIDRSNVGKNEPGEWVLLLPDSPDASATKLRSDMLTRAGTRIGVIINDSMGRAWRNGTVGLAIGCAGVQTVADLRGLNDRDGMQLEVTTVGVADEIAAAASFVMGQANESIPVVLVRGAKALVRNPGHTADLLRDPAEDLFR